MVQMAARGASTDALLRLAKRCVECPSTSPSCPTCKPNETCSLIPQSCNSCASTQCVAIGSLPGQAQQPKSSTPVGPIVGGVIGGVAAIMIGVFCIWYCCIKPRRRKDTWNPPEKRDQSTLARAGDRTHSIASTILSRASNVIQIAYIPGITGRSPPESPNMVPPMPSIPAAYANSTANTTPQPDAHFFMPNDLRDSTWSEMSIDPRISLAPSLARASVATTIMPPMPAQQAFRAQANMVSLKQGSSSHTPSIPEMPKPVNINGSSIVARNVTARPIEVKKTGSATRVPTLGNLARASSTKTKNSDVSRLTELSAPVYEDKEVVLSPTTDIDSTPNTPAMLRSMPSSMSLDAMSTSGVSAVLPADGPLSNKGPSHQSSSDGISAMIEDAIRNATKDTRHSPRPGAQRQGSGPFSDSHELADTSSVT